MKLIVIAVVFLFIGLLFGSVTMAILAAGKTMEEEELWEKMRGEQRKEYEESKNKESKNKE